MGDQEGRPAREEITRLLHVASKGDRFAADELMQTVKDELRKNGRLDSALAHPHE